MKKILQIFLLLILVNTTFYLQAQNNTRFTISGYVNDADNGESLIGVSIYNNMLKQGTVTNAYGFFSLTLPQGTHELVFSYVGYETHTESITLNQNITFNLNLQAAQEELQEVVIKANSFQEKIATTQMSVEQLSMKEAKLLPALFGEVDIIKTLQLKPGVTSGGEGSSGIFVRGGGADQNLVLLDEAPVYNPSHLFGFFSSFNSDAVKSVDLYKGGFPAEYGGKLSSVIDVKLNDGNNKKFSGTGGLGLIASRLTLEAPIVKEKSSFIISARRTYVDIFTRAINKASEDKEDYSPIPNYYFYDLNLKANYILSDKDKIFISGFLSRDIFSFDVDDFSIDFGWGNRAATARWNHIFNPRLFLNTTFTFSQYDYKISNSIDIFSFDLGSGIEDYTLKVDFLYAPSAKHNIKFGGSGIHHTFDVNRINTNSEDGSFDIHLGSTLNGVETGVYISDDIEISDALKINTGLRWSGFANDGKFYHGLEPRFSARYAFNEKVSAKISYARMFQYVHLASSSGASLPTDVWYPSTKIVQPEISDQVAGGVSFLLGDKFLLSNEVYYKWTQRQIDFKDGAELFTSDNLAEEFVFGKGWSYGNEFYIEKTEGRTTGWIGYTWSKTWRQFDAISQGRKFPARNDRRHDISIVIMHQLKPKLSISAAWVYNTGIAYSLPVGRYYLQDISGAPAQIVPIYPDRNSFRMPAYHRLDLSMVWKFTPQWGESDLSFSVYNAYNRRNAYFIYFEEKTETVNINGEPEEITTGFSAKQVSLFPIIPSITWNFKF
ncbi:MAG: TonB-dependent receptor [Chitinophagales bacterium]|nr:TonB-dependent receptor [Bacteroidota bacterium]MCB9043862.1 TonB-dependent receptor [Chitinophagales bacterium]